jgi:iron complex transport system substrate-binding protein
MARRRPETRNPKSERNPKPETRNGIGLWWSSSFGFRALSILSDFGFRISAFFVLATLVGCDKHRPVPATQPASPTIASLVPAATELIIGMGARDRLMAVSTFDSDPDIAQLPKAGDYETIDWELLGSLHPSVLVTEISPDRQGPGFNAKAADRRIKPINVHIENLDDIPLAIDQLGAVLQEPQLALSAHQVFEARLDAVRRLAANEKPVRALIVTSAQADSVAGVGTYLDDLLKIAGGVNVVAPESGHWPMIDREKLLSLKPDVVLQLLPGTSPQERVAASRLWSRLSAIPAVASGRVYPIYDEYALVPGWHVTDLAEQFFRCLHPQSPTHPVPASQP